MTTAQIVTYEPYTVPFHDDAITCVDRDDSMFVALLPTCDAIGLPYRGQEQKLQRARWATMCKMHTVAADGKNREMTFIDRRTFALWLATLDSDKLADESIRAKLDRYQKEAADVLDRHFFGAKGQAVVPAETDPILALIESARVTHLRTLEHERRITAVEGHVASVEHKADAALARSGETGFMALLGYLNLKGLRFPNADMAKIGIYLHHYCKANGLATGTVPDQKYGTVKAWPIEALEAWRKTLPGQAA